MAQVFGIVLGIYLFKYFYKKICTLIKSNVQNYPLNT